MSDQKQSNVGSFNALVLYAGTTPEGREAAEKLKELAEENGTPVELRNQDPPLPPGSYGK